MRLWAPGGGILPMSSVQTPLPDTVLLGRVRRVGAARGEGAGRLVSASKPVQDMHRQSGASSA